MLPPSKNKEMVNLANKLPFICVDCALLAFVCIHKFAFSHCSPLALIQLNMHFAIHLHLVPLTWSFRSLHLFFENPVIPNMQFANIYIRGN